MFVLRISGGISPYLLVVITHNRNLNNFCRRLANFHRF
jgi:hypothetical protein